MVWSTSCKTSNTKIMCEKFHWMYTELISVRPDDLTFRSNDLTLWSNDLAVSKFDIKN